MHVDARAHHPGGVVAELMHMTLRPGDGAEKDRMDLGCDASPPRNSALRGLLHAITRQVHAVSRAPSHATFGLASPIPRDAQLTSMKASRWTVMMCQAWGGWGFLRILKRRARRPTVPTWLYGGQQHRRREVESCPEWERDCAALSNPFCSPCDRISWHGRIVKSRRCRS